MDKNSDTNGKAVTNRRTATRFLSIFLLFITITRTVNGRVETYSENNRKSARRWKLDSCFQNKKDYDVMFVIDAAVSRRYLRYNQRLIGEVTRKLNIVKTRPKIGFVAYGVGVDKIISPTTWSRQSQVQDAVNSISPSNPPKRNVARALNAAALQVKFQGSRRSFVILFVGGRSVAKNSVQQAAEGLREKRPVIIIVGYDQADATFLRDTAKAAGTNHMVYIEDAMDMTGATDIILSMMCEGLLNSPPPAWKAVNSPIKKKSAPAKVEESPPPPALSIPDVLTTTSTQIKLKWLGDAASLAAKFRVTWIPRDGEQKTVKAVGETAIRIQSLRPATIYKIKMVPGSKDFIARPLTIITATAPAPVSNLSAEVKFVEPCSLQKELLKMHRGSKVGIPLKQIHCDSQRTVVFVGWNESANSKYYMLNTVPKTARLIRVTRRSTEQFLSNVSPGQEYTLSVIATGPQLLLSEKANASVVIPPVDPIRLDTAVINQTTVAFRWRMPANTIFDGFLIDAVSAYERKSARLDVTGPAESFINPVYSYVAENLRPSTNYEVSIMTISKNTSSPGRLSVKFSTKSPTDLHSEPFLVISTGYGIHTAVAGKNEKGSRNLEKILSVPGGVVNSIYHSRWIKPRDDKFTSTGRFRWQKLLIWIGRQSREIKITDLTSPMNTVTLVSGLLQPVGLVIDPYGENIYWTDIGSRSIGVVSLSSKPGLRKYQVNRNLVSGDMEAPVSIAIAVVDRLFFWGDSQGIIERSNLDGSRRIVVYKKAGSEPQSLSFCEDTRTLYWIDGNAGTINRMLVSGANHEVFHRSATTNIMSLVIAGPMLVWFDEDKGSFFSLPKRSKEEIEQIYSNVMLPSVTSMSSFDPAAMERGYGIGLTSLDLLLSLMKESRNLSFPCHKSGSTCNGVCIPTAMNEAVCVTECKPWQLLCYKSIENKCVDDRFICDGNVDCPNGEDEELSLCEEKTALNSCNPKNTSEFQCYKEGGCIALEGTCNGRLDCVDGSDEKKCISKKQSCDFESKNLCLWKQEQQKDEFDWTIHQGQTPSNLTGPLMDHTMLTVSGSYLYLEATPRDEGDKANLVSVLHMKPVCVSFYYYMHGEMSGSLNLLHRDHSTGLETILWSKSGEQGAIWNRVQVSVDKHSLYQLVIQGVRGADYRSDIAIDDISIESGLCSVPQKCDFSSLDDAMCGYQLGENWRKVHGDIIFPGSEVEAPAIEKPMTQDLSGILGPEWFYFDFTFDDFPGCSECNGAKLVRDISNTKFGRNGVKFVGVTICTRNWYKLYLSETLSGPFRNIGDGAGKGEDHCEFIGATEYAKDIGNFKECEGNLGFVRRRWGESVDLEPFGFHQSVYFSPGSYQCNFEFPQFVIDNDPLIWIRNLPNSYIFLDFSRFNEHKQQKVETLKVPVFIPKDRRFFAKEKLEFLDPDVFTLAPTRSIFNHEKIEAQSSMPKPWCLKFRYFMVGSDTEMLKVSINNEYDVWVKNGPQGKLWKKAEVDIPYPAAKYDLVFTVARGEGYEGSVGIDDVEVIYEPCGQKANYKCSFDVLIEEECSFIVTEEPAEQIVFDVLYETKGFSPEIVKNREYSSGVISGQEVTLVNGTVVNSKPVLRSPLLPSLSQFYPVICLTVDYKQRADFGELSVSVLNKNGKLILKLSEHQLPQRPSPVIRPWLTYVAQIDETVPVVTSQPFYLELHGLNATWVNELSLHTAECKSVAPNQCRNAVKCNNGNCVRPDLLCDGVDDCGDWSDEIGCSSYCGSKADYFEVEEKLGSDTVVEKRTCSFRIHGQPGKYALIKIKAIEDLPALANVVVTVYKGFAKRIKSSFSASFSNGSFVFTINDFSKDVNYLVESHNATVIVEYSGIPTKQINLSYEMVKPDHCSLICPDHHCLVSNYFCDGRIGCTDGSDERNCARIVEKDGVKIVEIKYRDEPFAPICGDDVTEEVADAICKQLNDLHAQKPIVKAKLPDSYNPKTLYRLVSDYRVTDTTLIQALIETRLYEDAEGNVTSQTQPKKTDNRCESREAWVPNCVSYQCGVRPMDANPLLRLGGGLSPMLRIVGGTRSKTGSWPWIASLLFKDRRHNCGGTLISDRHIITAAHCFDDNKPSDFTVLLGAASAINPGAHTSRHTIKKFVDHEMYNKRADIPDYDIAILEFTPPVQFTTFISPICVPYGDMEFPPGTKCHIAGFGHEVEGRPGNSVLNEATTPILSTSECDTGPYRNSITDRMVCTGYPDRGGIGICHGDSGGPLMCETEGSWYLVGVTSWSIGCANKGKPDVFSRILSYVGWINDNTGFNLTVPNRSKKVVGTCGGTYYGSLSGSFASPGWPGNYGNDLTCTYVILANLGQTIHLRFEDFDSESHFDVLNIYTGDMQLSNKILNQHSGISKPRSINARTSALYIVFTSDGDTSGKGFIGNWELSGIGTTYEGPGHPIELRLRGRYEGRMVLLSYPFMGTFVYAGVGAGGWPYYLQHSPRRVTHKLAYLPHMGYWTVRPVTNYMLDGNVGMRIVCADTTPDTCHKTWEVWSGTDWMDINLVLDVKKDLELTTPTNIIYSTTSGSQSTTKSTSASTPKSTLSSLLSSTRSSGIGLPVFPTRTTRSPQLSPSMPVVPTQAQTVGRSESRNRRAAIDDSYFYMEFGSGVEFVEGSTQYYGDYNFLTSFVDAKPDPTCNYTVVLNSTETRISYFAESDGTTAYKVQNCLWTIQTDGSDQNITAEIELGPYNSGIIAYTFLAGNDDDMFRVDMAPRDILRHSITVFNQFQIYFDTDGLGVGFNATIKMVPAFSSAPTTSPASTTSTTQPRITTTTTANVGNGEVASVQITANCENATGILRDQFYIQSPNHPKQYEGNVACTWVMKAPSTHRIGISFIRMAIEFVSDECSYDNVTVYDDEATVEPAGIFCGTALPEPIISKGSVMIVKFATDKFIQDTGFRALITALEPDANSDLNSVGDVIFSCDFKDEDICGFAHDKSDDVNFVWSRHLFTTGSEGTGPPYDASESKTGYYMYTEASIPRIPGDRARLISPLFESKPMEDMCLSFAYSMKGKTVGSLIVYVLIAGDGTMEVNEDESVGQSIYKFRPVVSNFGAGLNQTRMKASYSNTSTRLHWQQYLLWSKTEQQPGQPWLTAEFTFTPNNHFKLLFEGIRGSDYQSDIAIDNVVLHRGACRKINCNEGYFKCRSGELNHASPICISDELICDGHYDCEDGSDEEKCSFPLSVLCNRADMDSMSSNSTKWMICHNMDKCSPSKSISDLDDIICDGVYDCFGGFDESSCHSMSQQTENGEFCGEVSDEDEEITDRSKIHNIPHSIMPWMAGLHIQVPSAGESKYIFLCSATFIQNDWLLIPAHCILDPEMKKEDLEEFLQDKREQEPDNEENNRVEETDNTLNNQRFYNPMSKELPDLNELRDLYRDEFPTEEFVDLSQTVFEYYVMSSSEKIFHVTKLIPHPRYAILQHLHCNHPKSSSRESLSHDENDTISCDVTRVNYDIALVKIEGGATEDELEDVSTACINELDIPISLPKVNSMSPTEEKNMFKPPTEGLAYSKGYKTKTTCYAVGYSFDKLKESTDLKLSRRSVLLSYGDQSSSKLLCGMQTANKPDNDCLEKYRDNTSLQPLYVGGYREIRNAPFMYDGGPVVMCKSWDERWHLTGLYSWMNFYQNQQRDLLYQMADENDITGGVLTHGSVIGIPMGVDLFMDVSRMANWVNDTLAKDCPGEFPCYDSSSHLTQKCIPKHKQCDGIIDCPLNYADEITCASGCKYDLEKDPFHKYYQLLEEYGVDLPVKITRNFNLTTTPPSGDMSTSESRNSKSIIVDSGNHDDEIPLMYEEDNEKSWRSVVKNGKIRANTVMHSKRKMCIWTIKAPEGQVASLHMKEFNAVDGGNRIQIINSGSKRNDFLHPGMKDAFYTSNAGGTLTIRILPPPGQIYLNDIRYLEADHRVEPVGVCQNRHRCGDGTCVSPHHVCDGIWDCADRSDETKCLSGCGGPSYISGPSSGFITSKNYPFGDGGNGDCQWQFVTENGKEDPSARITFEFVEFRTDDSDSMFLFSGSGRRKSAENLLGAFSGEKEPFQVSVQGNSATLLLRSNDFVWFRKFKIKYTIRNS